MRFDALARLRAEAYRANGQPDETYLLQRYELAADGRFGAHVRVFIEPISALESFRVPGPRPFDEDALDVHQGFVDVTAGGAEEQRLTLRVGRQEMELGASRYVGVREPQNVRLTFDGARLLYELPSGRTTVTAFALEPTFLRPGVLDDKPDSTQRFWGLYGTQRASADVGIDWHYFGQARDRAVYQRGVGEETRHAAGGRVAGRAGDFDFDVEGTVQSGRFADVPIFAYGAATFDGYTLRRAPLRPRASLRVGLASGDTGGRALGTLNAFYPRFAFPSDDGTVGGPANTFDVHPGFEVHAGAFTAGVDWDFLWRVSTRDGIYTPAVALARSAVGSRDLALGSQAAALVDWQPTRRLKASIAFAHAFIGPFLHATGARSDIEFGAATLEYDF